MKELDQQTPLRYCGRLFTMEEIEAIRRLIAWRPPKSRVELSRLVCQHFGWMRPDGRLKEMTARVAMLRMHREELICLPPPRSTNANGRSKPKITSASDPQPIFCASLEQIAPIHLQWVNSGSCSALWNELIQRHHYLGYTPLPGAQLRYLLWSGEKLLGALGFGASAWMVAPRDRFIGWNDDQRKARLHLVVNHARFLILPWIRVKNLASKTLAMGAGRLGGDWKGRYGYEPVLLETFVDSTRFQGTCYRAANWVYVGKTQGRGKLVQ
jgi:hypothetical protein